VPPPPRLDPPMSCVEEQSVGQRTPPSADRALLHHTGLVACMTLVGKLFRVEGHTNFLRTERLDFSLNKKYFRL